MLRRLHRCLRWSLSDQTSHSNAYLLQGFDLQLGCDDEAIRQWKQSKQDKRGRPRQFSDLAITTALMVKRVFSMPLRALQGVIESVFSLANFRIVCPHYSCISRRAKQVEVSFKPKSRGAKQHLAIDATGLKVYSEGEWKFKKHGTEGKRKVACMHVVLGNDDVEIKWKGIFDAILHNIISQPCSH